MKRSRFFQIGFNKSGTTSLYKLFSSSGIPCLKYTGKTSRLAKNVNVRETNVQKIIAENIRYGRPPLATLEDARAFFDMEFVTNYSAIENFRYYKTFYEHYPNAKFLLNVREKYGWLQSRCLHANGDYLLRAVRRHNRTGLEVMNMWMEEYDRHLAEVRGFFADKPFNFLEFDIQRDPIEKLVEFVEPDFELDTKHWDKLNATKATNRELRYQIVDTLFEVPPLKKSESPLFKDDVPQIVPEGVVPLPLGKWSGQERNG